MENEVEMRERLAKLEQDSTSVHRRLDSLEELTKNVSVIASEIKAMREDMNGLNKKVDEIERRPARRYETIITATITAIIGIIVGYFLQI